MIINIVSQAGLQPKAERSVYNASKYAMTGFTRSMELELKESGIRVVGIYPGKVNTRLFSKTGIEKNMSDAIQPENIASLVSFVLSQPKDVIEISVISTSAK